MVNRKCTSISFVVFILVVIATQKYGHYIQIPQRRRMDALQIYADPKSINSKNELPTSFQWRVLNFGTSVSWGASLKDRLHEAYPYLLSPHHVTNLAIRAQGPSFPSVCTQTMVGDDSRYNVIILEFYLRATEGLELLTKRLRQRFPKAVIVLIRRWNPLMFQYRPSNTGLKDWMEQHGFAQKLQDTKFHRYLLQHTEREDWILHSPDSQKEIQDRVARKFGALIYSLPLLDDPRQSIAMLSSWFSKDMNHLSAEGHAVVATGIRELIQNSGVTIDKQYEIGNWDGGDLCDTWYWTGESSSRLSYGDGVQMLQFDQKNNKWALEIPSSGGWITVENPFDDNKLLAITVMATDPPSIYPITRVTSYAEDGSINFVDIDPTVVDDRHFGEHVHIGVTKVLGSFPPGKIRLRFQPMQENKERPLRITGYALSDVDFDIESLRYIRNIHPV